MLLTAESLSKLAPVRHGFFTRRGGASEGIYASLNCGFGSDDAREAVTENRRRALAALSLPADGLHTVYQVHSPDVVVLEQVTEQTEAIRADALVTQRKNVALGVLAADCAPILFADPEAGVIAAAHAGWRGALGGVAENTVAAMAGLGAVRERITATIGPCIGPESYEVGPEFPQPFCDADAENERFFEPAPRAGHFLFDLPGFVLSRLAAAGVGSPSALGMDTYADEDLFSYRRSCHRSEPDYGRNLSAIALTGEA